MISDRIITFFQPKKLVFGNGCSSQFVEDLHRLELRKAFIITTAPLIPLIEPILDSLRKYRIQIKLYDSINREPTKMMFNDAMCACEQFQGDAVIGIGGGSVLDTAKLVASLYKSNDNINDVFGIGKVKGRDTYLACLPTTSGTGSEVSPNAIILDEKDNMKKGIISPYLVPDASYVDPMLTVTVPPDITASTGMDALTHCIEAYVNRFAHPVTDLYALEGVKLIGNNIVSAYKDGSNLKARENMSLGSLYGGLCLGPVNTGAAHVLSYPLGSKFHIPHGISNALFLPYVIEFNMPVSAERYADIALALGVSQCNSPLETAQKGLEKIRHISKECRIPEKLSQLGIPKSAIRDMAESAMTVTRLLKNNVRELTLEDAESIYKSAY